MSIKKGVQITASDINDLKTKVISIYNKRSFLSNAGYTTTTITANSSGFGNTSIALGNNINQNFYYSLNALLQLNDIQNITVSNTTGDYIFKNSHKTEDLMTIVNNWNNIPNTTPSNITTKPISCRGGCVGLCWNHCDGTCTYACLASNNGNNGDYGGAWDGQGSTGYNCNGDCQGRCKDTCVNGCYHTCSTGCGTSCGNSCTGGCAGECNASCSTGCIGSADMTLLQ